MINIGRCIRLAQADKEVSSKELAERLNTARQTINRYRTSDDLKLSVIDKVSTALGLTVIELLNYDA